MEDIRFLTLEEVIKFNEELVILYGGKMGLRELSLLDSAIAQPQVGWHGKYLCNDAYEMACTYMYHIIKNHPFIDGNKRTGVFCFLVFLKYNDFVVNVSQNVLYKLALDIASSKISKKELIDFIKKSKNKKNIKNIC